MNLFRAALIFISIMVLLTLEVKSYTCITGNNYIKDINNKLSFKITVCAILCIICYIIIRLISTYILGNQFEVLSAGLILSLIALSLIVADKLNNDSVALGLMIALFTTMIYALCK